ncbi:MAG: aldose epimerase family protein [Planctomycetota bacterium]
MSNPSRRFRPSISLAATLAIVSGFAAGCVSSSDHTTRTPWGVIDSDTGPLAASVYTLRNDNGLVAKFTDFGATLIEFNAPDRNGDLADITLGFDDAALYMTDSPYFGTVAGRSANRIERGQFTLDGETYQLATNNGANHLHGGDRGFDKHMWEGQSVDDSRGQAIRFTRTSPEGEENYPGTLDASVTYVLTDDNEFITEFSATTDAPTLCNLAQHAYWNLGGHDSGSIRDHQLTIFSDEYTPVDAGLIPTGELVAVAGTPFDFRAEKPIGQDLESVGDDPKGYDHNFVIRGTANVLRPVLRAYDPASGRIMELRADKPGLQFYSGNFLDGSITGKDGVAYEQYAGFCAESQHFPNAINEPAWASPILRPGETYSHTMVTRFTTDVEEN